VPSAPLLVAAISLAIWLYLFAARGKFWNLQPFDDDNTNHAAPATWPSVAAIIPARNEAETIAQTIASLSRQDYSGKFSIVVVDDHSEDATAQLALEFVQTSTQANLTNNLAHEVTILFAPPLQPGWTGKLSALNAGINFTLNGAPDENVSSRAQRGIRFSSAVPQTSTHEPPTYFWFTDADVVHAPDTLQRLVSRAEQNNLDLTSLMVLLRAQTLPERFLIPPFLFFFLKLYPPSQIANPNSRTAGAAGGCILLRRTALDRIGGLAAIRSEVIDDCALARAVKRSATPDGNPNAAPHAKIWMGVTRKNRSLRAYSTFAEIRDMIARTAFTQLHYSALLLIGTLAGLALTYLAPIALLFAHDTASRLTALLTWFIMSLLFLPTVRYYRMSTHWSVALPLAALFYAVATTLSATRYWTNRGAHWKGRSQAPK
jgi:hopene-associated glycosyltransferase HpnB